MKNRDKLLKKIKDDTNRIPIPESVTPKGVRKTLEEYDKWSQVISYHEAKTETKDIKEENRKSKKRGYRKLAAAAACLCLVASAVAVVGLRANHFKETLIAELFPGKTESNSDNESGKAINGGGQNAESKGNGIDVEMQKNQEVFAGKHTTYAAIYASMERAWEERNQWFYYAYDMAEVEAVAEEAAVPEAPAADMGSAGLRTEMQAADYAADNTFASDAASSTLEEKEASEYGATNVQTVGVDEGDIVKNDGRYLYQLFKYEAEKYQYKQAIQIIDTKEGLTEVVCIDDFESVAEFYIWEDILVVIENKYLDNFETLENGAAACYDVAYFANEYHEISIFDIKDRSKPEKIKTFTLKGSYQSSRIANGYFYGFSRFYASEGEGEEDYDAYIPVVDGVRLEEEQLLLPEGSKGTAYLVIVSIDLRKPTEFMQTAGIVTDSEQYYVSGSSIYVTDTRWAGEEEEPKEAGTGENRAVSDTAKCNGDNNWKSDKTVLLRLAYQDGYFALQAEGEIKGSIDDTFSLDEYNDHLRVVTTVREYLYETVMDDRTGEVMGSAISKERQTNALYVLDEDLKLTGKIEGLAENEQIYSARFMGNTGYFVTFRLTDPLFAVDLTDPANPKILSELKVSGLSEYLHFYGDGLLFGLGREVDENTGIHEGMKLSMFDISDPANVQEITRLLLDDYYLSEALYNHKAVLIHPGANLIGFEAEGYAGSDSIRYYYVYSYENGTFVQRLNINTKPDDGMYYLSRGTFIGDVFYLLRGDGSVTSYDLNTGELLASLVHEE